MVTGSGKFKLSDNQRTGISSVQLKPGQPRMLRPIRPKMEKKSGPRISGRGHNHNRSSQRQGVVRHSGPISVTGQRMPRGAPSARMPGPAPPAGLRAHGPTPVRGLTGIDATGGSHRRALSFPQYRKAQNIRSPSPPQSESNDLQYPTPAALSKFA